MPRRAVRLVDSSCRLVRGSSSHLLAALCLTLLLAFPFAPSVGAGAPSRAELTKLRTETSRTYRNPNGTYSTVLHSEPIQFKEANGRWAAVDSTLVQEKADGYAYANRANRFRVRFRDELKGDFVRVELGTIPYSLSLAGASKVDAEVRGTSAAYRDALPHTDLQYDVSATELKETLVLKDRRAPNRFRFMLRGRLGDHPRVERRSDGSWEISTPREGHSAIVLRAPFATDRSNGAPLTTPHAKLTARSLGNRVALDLVVDEQWLRAPSRRFPVRVDPTIQLTGNTADASFNFKPSCGTCLPVVDQWLLIGTEAGNAWRAAARFDLGDLPPGANVTSANLRLYYAGWCILPGGNCGPQAHVLEAHKLLKPWGHGTTTGEMKVDPDTLATFPLATNAPEQWMAWNVTRTVENWQHGLIPNHGFIVQRSSETGANDSGPQIYSTRWSEPSHHPRLEVTYTSEAVELFSPPTLHSNGADLSWTQYSSLTGEPFERYEVHRSRNARFIPSRATLLATITEATTTTYRDTTAAPAKTFTYKIATNGAPSNERTVTLPPNGQASKLLQPGPEGVDNHIWSEECDNHGADDELEVGRDPWGKSRTLITFTLGDIPGSSTVRTATLSLWHPWQGAGPPINLHRLTASWVEGNGNHACDGGGATWQNRSPGIAWTTPGGDFDPSPAASVPVPNDQGGAWDQFNVTSLVDQWVRGVVPNHGALIKVSDENPTDTHFTYFSSDWTASAALRPKLAVFYDDGSDAIEPTVSISEPASGLVKGNAKVTAAASDDRRVETVEFFVDGKEIAADHSSPFSVTWDSKKWSNGPHSLTAKAIDDAGNETTSSPVQVTVGNSAHPSTTVEVVPSAVYASVVAADRPLGQWRLGEAPPNVTAADSSGNGRHGEYQNGVTQFVPGALTGDSDRAASFDGIDDRVRVPDDDALDLNGSWTIEFWAKQTAFANEWPGLIRKGPSHTADGYLIFYEPNGKLILKRNDQYATTWVGALTSSYRHFVVAHDGSHTRWYVDGALQTSTAVSWPQNNGTESFRIGQGDHFGNHVMDEVAVYAKALSQPRIRLHYRTGKSGVRSAYLSEVKASNPDTYLRLGEAPGAGWARDATRNRYDGIYELYAHPGVPGALTNDTDTAATFNAPVEDGIVVRHRDVLDFDTHDFTVEAWVKTTQNGERAIMGKNDAPHPGWRLTVTDDAGWTGRLRLALDHTGGYQKFYGPSTRIDDGTWHHVVASVTRSQGADLYVDGVRESSVGPTLGDLANGIEFEIGDTHDYETWQGEIDEVAIYSHALPVARVQVHNDKGRTGSGYADAVLHDEPRAYWRLGEPADWVRAWDDSGNAHHGRFQGPVAGLDGALDVGDSNTAVNFNDDRFDFVDLGDRYDFAGTAPFSLEAWIRPTNFSGCGRIFSKEDENGAGRQGWTLCSYMDGDEPGKYGLGFLRFRDGQDDSTWTPEDFDTGKWSHVVAVYTGSELFVYVNGQEVAWRGGMTRAMLEGTRPARIGDSDWAWWDPYEGDIDEAAIYTRALSEQEVNEHYDAAIGAGNGVAGTATVRAQASDDVAVTKVEFYSDGVKFAEDLVAPYEVSWNTLDVAKPAYDGVHHLTSKAYDAHDQVTESSRVRVTVSNTAGTPYGAEITSVAMPDSLSGQIDLDVKVKNTSNQTWAANRMEVGCRWIDPVTRALVQECGVQTIWSALASDETREFAFNVWPPTLPPGVSRTQYRLQFDVRDTQAPDPKWFERRGNRPLEQLVSVIKTLPVGLGLERYYQYEGGDLGAGLQHLVNIANGNSLLRWTPFGSPGRGLSTVVDLTYNSLEGTSESPVGNGWSLSVSSLARLGTPLRLATDGLSMELIDGDGTLHRFEKGVGAGGTYWKEPPGVHLYLRETGSPDPAKTWAATKPDRVTFYFDADGNPTSVEDPNGNRIVFTLEPIPPLEQRGSATKRVVAVTDASGAGRPIPNDRSFRLDYYSTSEHWSNQVWGRLQKLMDHTGTTLEFTYFDNGNLLEIDQVGEPDWEERGRLNAPPRTLRFESIYPTNRINRVVDPLGNDTLFEYHPDNKLWKRLDRSKSGQPRPETSLTYNTSSRETITRDPRQMQTVYVWDADGKPLSVTNQLLEKTRLTWSRDRHVTKVIEPTGRFVEYAYDDNGYLTDQLDELRSHTKLEYEYIAVDSGDVAGRWADGRTLPHISQIVRKTDPNGMATQSPPDDYQWTFSHDDRGNVVKTTDPLGHSEETLYHQDGTVSAEIDANRNKTTFAGYEQNGLPTVIVEPTGATTRLGYDEDGLLAWVQDPNHAEYPTPEVQTPADYRSELRYDVFHRLARQTAPKSTEYALGDLIETEAQFDANDNVLISLVYGFGTGSVANYEHDAMDRPRSVSTPPHDGETASRRTEFAYDLSGNLELVTRPKGVATPGDPDDYTTEYTYDPVDRVTRETTASRQTNYCFDRAGDLRSVTAPKSTNFTGCPENAQPETYTYTTATHTTKFEYDEAHRPVTQTDPVGNAAAMAYDANGDVVAQTDPQGATTTQKLNERGELVQIVQPFVRNGNGKVTRALTTRLEYDAVGNLTREISPRAFDATTPDFGWRNYATSYDYDSGDRLVRVRLPNDDATRQAWVHTAYDANGNVRWTSVPVDSPQPSSVVDAQRTLLTHFDPGWVRSVDEPVKGAVLFDYDPVGRQIMRDAPASMAETWTYYHDGRVKENHDPNQHVNRLTYDLNGNLVAVDDSTGVDDNQTPMRAEMSYNEFDELEETRQRDEPVGGPPGPWRYDSFFYDRNGNLEFRNEDSGPNARFHEFVYDQADRLTHDYDDGLVSICADDQVVETTYTENSWTSREEIRRRSSQCEESGWPIKQLRVSTYHASGDVATQKTYAGTEGPANIVESHELDYTDDDDIYVNGNRVEDEFVMLGPGDDVCTLASPCAARYGYDARERLTSWANGLPGDDAISIAYTLDTNDPDAVDTLSGDVTRQVTTTYENGQPQTDIERFTYTPGGQLTARFDTDDPNADPVERYFYGVQTGNLRCVTGPQGSGCSGAVLESFSWDTLDRLKRFDSFRASAEIGTSYVYDAFDRVKEQTETRPGSTHRTGFGYLGLTDAVSNETNPATQETRRTYSYDANLNRVSMTRNGLTHTYARNPRGDVSMLLGETDGATAAYGYKPYGEIDTGLFAGDTNDQNALNPFRFNDRRWDSGSGSIDMGARRFSPDTGRFLEQDFYRSALSDVELGYDPLTQNRYGFAGGNPVSFVETDGHGFLSVVCAAARTMCEFAQFEKHVLLGAWEFARVAGPGLWSMTKASYDLHPLILRGDVVGCYRSERCSRRVQEIARTANYIVRNPVAAGKSALAPCVMAYHKHGPGGAVGCAAAFALVGFGTRGAGIVGSLPRFAAVEPALLGAARTARGLTPRIMAERPAVYGTRVHATFAQLVEGLRRQGLDVHSEVVYRNGQVLEGGRRPRGSIAADVVVGDPRRPTAIYDLKTGKGGLTAARIRKIRRHLPRGYRNIPIRELR